MILNTDINSESRIQFLDALKGLCVVFVIILHFPWSDAERLNALFPFWVGMSVPIFMIISGYALSGSLAKNKVSTIEEAYGVKTVLPKLVRYTVPFCVAFLIELLYLIAVDAFPGALGTVYLFLQGGCGPGGYYYPVLLQLVFVFPFIYFAIRREPERGLFLCFLVNVAYEILKNAYWINEECYRVLVFRYIFPVAFGCYLFFAPAGIKPKRCLLLFGIGLVYLLGIVYWDYQPRITQLWSQTSVIATLYIIPIFQLLWNKYRHCRIPLMGLLGKASYNIYLVQMVYYYLCSDYVYLHISNRKVQLITNIVVCVSAGILFYRLERPITNRLCRAVAPKLETPVNIDVASGP